MRAMPAGSIAGPTSLSTRRAIGEPGSAARRHADQPAHRGAEPVHRLRVEAGEQRHHVGDVGRQRVARRIGEPIRLAAADDVGADDAPAVAHRPRQRVEVAALARQRRARRRGRGRCAAVAPLPVRHAVQAARVEALDVAQAAARSSVHGASSLHLDRAVDGRGHERLARLDRQRVGRRRAPSPACATIGIGPGCGSLVATFTSRTA